MQKSIRNFACVFFTSFTLIGPLQERISKLKLREPIAFWEGPVAYLLSATSDVLMLSEHCPATATASPLCSDRRALCANVRRGEVPPRACAPPNLACGMDENLR